MSDEIKVNSENTPPRKNLATLGQVKDALDKRDEKIESLKKHLDEVKREIGGESIVSVDVEYYANPKHGSNTGFFHTDDFEIQSDATIRFSKNYGQLFVHNTLTDVETTLTDGIVLAKGSYWLQGYTMPVTQMTSESALAEVKNDINIQVVEKVDGEIWDRINEKFDGLKGKTTNFEIDLTFLADSYIPTSDKFFHTEPFTTPNEFTVEYSGTYGQFTIRNVIDGTNLSIVSGTKLNGGTYVIFGYATPIATVTDAILAKIKDDIKVVTTKMSAIFESENTITRQLAQFVPTVNGDSKTVNAQMVDAYSNPFIPVFGHEYLEHWYETIYNADKPATIVLEGDSITEGYNPDYSSVNDAFLNMRGWAIKKIMKIGNFPMSNLTVVNNGHGGRKTGEWVGDATYGASSVISQYTNGYLDVTMQSNPNLLILAYGMNDADKTNSELKGLTTEQRINVFKNHMIEGLERIRGNQPVNGRPSYNKPSSQLSIIICMPTVGGNENTGRGFELWNQYLRDILVELCRKYECAFVDLTYRTYAHNKMQSRIWSTLTTTGSFGGIHPNKYSNAQIMSALQDLIYPICMWNVDVE